MATIFSICFVGQVLDKAVKTGLLMHPVDSLYNFTRNNTKPLTTIVMVHVLLLLHFLVLFLVFFVTLIEITRGDSTESTFLEHIFLILWPFPWLIYINPKSHTSQKIELQYIHAWNNTICHEYSILIKCEQIVIHRYGSSNQVKKHI